MASVLQTVENVTVADAKAAYTALVTAFNAEKTKIEAVVQAHIGTHTAQATAHTAEVTAAVAVLNYINPPATPAVAASNATKATDFVLTANTVMDTVVSPVEAELAGPWDKFKGLWDKLGGWRAPVVAAASLLLMYGCHSGLIK